MASESELFLPILALPRTMLVRGAGSYVWDDHGKRYLDFTSGIAVLALGHSHPAVTQVIAEQAATLVHCSNLYVTEPVVRLAEMLKTASFAHRLWFTNSGTESIEAALKFVRLHGHTQRVSKKKIIAFKGGFHGRTTGAVSITYQPAYREPFGELLSDVLFAEFNQLETVAALMDDDVCAIFVEPIQGEGGVHVATHEFLQGLRALCDRHDALLVFDEIQCGMGRTGKMFAYEHSGVIPDLMALAKPLAGGLPLGAILANEKVSRLLKPGFHGSTFAGGPLTTAVGCKVFELISTPEFLANVQSHGQYLEEGLQAIASRGSSFMDQRGLGLMRALVIRDPEKLTPASVVQLAAERGLLLTRAGNDAVRILPPLNCTREEIDEALAILETM